MRIIRLLSRASFASGETIVGVPKFNDAGELITTGGTAGGGGGGGTGLLNYSTSEQDTGVEWIDGKTIYQKTFQITMSAGSPTTTAHGITGYNQLVAFEGTILRSAGTKQYTMLPAVHPSLIGDQMLITVDQTNIVIADAGSQWDNDPLTCTIWYTKV